MPTDLAKVKELFLAVVEMSAAERATHLDSACAGDRELREQVEDLVRSHESSGELLPRSPAQILRDRSATEADGTAAFAGAGEPSATMGEQAQGEAGDLRFLTPTDKPGQLGKLGPYEVQSILGKGGFGVVLRGFDERLHRVVAIKVLSPAYAANGAARKRFIREARAAAAVKNEHVVGIHDVKEDAEPPYLVMEYIDGVSLQDKIDRQGPLDIKEILRIGMQIAEGLAAAHKQGLVHRDIKPANILLENGVERVKITDFGLARAVDDASVTQSGTVAGTPMYMSPEQAEGLPIDHRSDLFSLGTVLYAMCTGHPPFRASGTHAVLKRVIDASPRPIREINNEMPEWLCDIIAKLHAKKPEERYQTAREVAEQLGQRLADVQAGRSVDSNVNARESTKAQPRTPVSSAPTAAVSHPELSSRIWLGLGMGLFVLIVGAAGWYIGTQLGRGTPPPPTIPPATTVQPPYAQESPRIIATVGKDGWVQLFNGKDLDGFTVSSRQGGEWTVKDGILIGKVDPKKSLKTNLVSQRNDYVNFHARVEMKLTGKCGGGLLFHAESPNFVENHAMVNLTEKPGRMIGLNARLAKGSQTRYAATPQAKLKDEWFTLEVIALHPKVIYRINGESVLERDDIRFEPGHLALSLFLADATMEVRKFEIRELPRDQVAADSDIDNLKKLAKLCEENLALANNRFTAGMITLDDVNIAEIEWLEAKIRLAQAEKNSSAMDDLGRRLIERHEDRLAYVRKKHEAGVVNAEAVNALERKLVEVRLRFPQPARSLPTTADQVLPGLAGTWKGEYTQKVYGSKPDVKKISAVAVNDWIIGQKWLRQRVQMENEGFQSVTTFDPGSQTFRDWFFHSRGLIFGPSTGRWDAATRTITWTNLPEDGVILLMTLRFVDADTLAGEIIIRDKAGKTEFEMSSQLKRTTERVTIDENVAAGPLPKEMVVLHRLVGDWQTSGVIKNAKAPDGRKASWQSSVRSILGGRVIATMRTNEPDEDESYSLSTFDTFSKAYGRWSFRANGNVMEYGGLWDEEIQTLKWHWAGKDGSQSSNIWELRDANRRDWQVITKDALGKTTFDVQATSVRQNEPGWVQLFNGKDFEGWDLPKLDPGNWSVVDGAIVRKPGTTPDVLTTRRRDYGNFHLRAEAKVSDQGNGGIRIRISEFSGYQAQINSTDKLPAKTGSLVKLLEKGGPAVLVASPKSPVPPDTWFTLEVIAEGPTVTVKVNGVKTAEIRSADSRIGPIGLAASSNTEIHFRNVEIKELTPAIASWEPLFNGKNLDGWNIRNKKEGLWTVEMGVLKGTAKDKKPYYLLSQRGDYEDFHWRTKAQLNGSGSSTVYFRIRDGAGWKGFGVKLDQITADDLTISLFSMLNPSQILATRKRELDPSRWFQLEVLAEGPRVELKLDGKSFVIHTFTEEEHAKHDANGGIILMVGDPHSVFSISEMAIQELPRAGRIAQPDRLTNNLGMKFVRIPKGKAWLGGSAGTPGNKEVEIKDDFYLGVYEVTQEEWEKVMGNNPSHFSRKGDGGDAVASVSDEDLRRFPVDNVSLVDCQEFLKRLNAKLNETGWEYRLPTPFEWEYACRGGPSPNKGDFGFDYYLDRPTNTIEDTEVNAVRSRLRRTCPVGSYAPNKLGLFDMHGNVAEWCPTPSGGPAVLGGGWDSTTGHYRASSYVGYQATVKLPANGLRVARVRLTDLKTERGKQ